VTQLVCGKTSFTSTARCLEETSVVKKSICEHLLEVAPKVTEFRDLRSAYIANCVFNTFLSYTAIMLNIVTIHAIKKSLVIVKDFENTAPESCCF